MSEREIAHAALRPTGERLLTPALAFGEEVTYRIVLEGECVCAANGARFDAVYRYNAAGEAVAHRYLQWSPSPPALVSADRARHRYVFRVDPHALPSGGSLGLRIDTDAFVDELLLPPSEVRASLSGALTTTVIEASPPPAWWPTAAWSGAGVVAVGAFGWIARRKALLRGLDRDLEDQVARILRKSRAARAALAGSDSRTQSLAVRLPELQSGAFVLARRAQDLRRAARLASDTQVVAVCASDRPAQSAWQQAARAEQQCVERLASIESSLDTIVLSLRTAQADLDAGTGRQATRAEMEAAVAALCEVARDSAEAEELRLPISGRPL